MSHVSDARDSNKFQRCHKTVEQGRTPRVYMVRNGHVFAPGNVSTGCQILSEYAHVLAHEVSGLADERLQVSE